MCTFCTSFRNKLYFQRQKQSVSHSSLVRLHGSLSVHLFLGRSPFPLAFGLYSYTNLWVCVSFILNKCCVHSNLQSTFVSLKLFIFSSILFLCLMVSKKIKRHYRMTLFSADSGRDSVAKDMFRFSCAKLYQIYSLCGRFRNLLSGKQLRQELALLLTQNMLIHLINFM